MQQMHKWGGGLYVKAPGGLDLHQAPAKRVWYTVYQRYHGGGLCVKVTKGFRKMRWNKSSFLWAIYKTENYHFKLCTLFWMTIAKNCMSLIMFLIVGDCLWDQ